jgi:hypothetical protein
MADDRNRTEEAEMNRPQRRNPLRDVKVAGPIGAGVNGLRIDLSCSYLVSRLLKNSLLISG